MDESSAGGHGTKMGYGVALTVDLILGTISTLGYILIRRSHKKEALKPENLQRRSFKRPSWHFGLWLYIIVGTVVSVIALSNLPFFVLVMLGAVKLVYNAVYSYFILHEGMTRSAFLGTFYIMISAVVIGILGVVEEPKRTVDQLLIMYSSLFFMLYEVTLLLFFVTLTYLSRQSSGRTSRSRGILIGVTSTFCANQAAFFAKSGLALLNTSILLGENQFTSFLPFFIVGMMTILALLGLYLFNKSLKLCETLVLIPIAYCVGIVLAVLNTVIYYDKADSIQAWKWVLIAIALVYLAYGVFELSWSRVAYTITLERTDEEVQTVQENNEEADFSSIQITSDNDEMGNSPVTFRPISFDAQSNTTHPIEQALQDLHGHVSDEHHVLLSQSLTSGNVDQTFQRLSMLKSVYATIPSTLQKIVTIERIFTKNLRVV